jgi:phosphopantetheinyl transferase (holo-ACP synthase)
LSETVLVRYPAARHWARVYLVTPAIVERAVARRGVAGLLTPGERTALEAIPAERRQRDWLAGRLAAKRVLRAACRLRCERVPSYRSIEILNEAGGAPRFTVQGRPELAERLDISIAHTDGTAVAAGADLLASGSAGVDIELTRPLSLDLVRRVLRAEEIARLEESLDTGPTPLELWTAKEAALKAARHLCDALRDIELSWNGTRTLRARVAGSGVPPHAILVRHRRVGPHTVALALRAPCQ